MNDDQHTITWSFVIVFGYLAVKHHWVSRAFTWIGKPPDKATANEPLFQKSINDWEAAVIAYAILLFAGASDLAPVAKAISVGLAFGTGLGAMKDLSNEYPSLFKRQAPPDVQSSAPHVPSSAAQGRGLAPSL